MLTLTRFAALLALVSSTAWAVPLATRATDVVRGSPWNELPLELYNDHGFNKTAAFGAVRDTAGNKVLDLTSAPEKFTFYGVGAHTLGTWGSENGLSNNDGETIVYGQLTPTAHPERCVTAHGLNTHSLTHFSAAPCVHSDDVNIGPQIWQLRLVPHCTGPHCAHEYQYDYQLYFIGGQVPTNQLGYYTLAPIDNAHQSLGTKLGEDRTYKLHFAN